MAVYDHNYLYMYFQLGPLFTRWHFLRGQVLVLQT
jgi:hypothetical protein